MKITREKMQNLLVTMLKLSKAELGRSRGSLKAFLKERLRKMIPTIEEEMNNSMK